MNEMRYKFMTPVEVWRDYDPTVEELDVTRVRTSQIDGITYDSMYFTAFKSDAGDVRVYARTMRSAKAKGALPVLIVIPPCKGVELDVSKFSKLAGEGYVVMTVDYEGYVEGKSRYTLYPEDYAFCNKMQAGRRMYHAEPSARDTTWYNWAIIARRAVTLAGELEYIDSDKIVMIGEGEGCPIVWQAVSQDVRVKGACTIFGYDLVYREGDTEERDCWITGVDMRSYASYVHIPFLHIGATNTRDNTFDSFMKISENMKEKAEFYTDFAFGHDGNVTEAQIKTFFVFLEKVFEGEKFATNPTFDVVTNDNGELEVKVEVEGAKSVALWYAYGSEAEKRLWKCHNIVKKNGVYSTKLGLTLGDEILRIFAKANFGKYSVCSSSKVIVPVTIGVKCAPRRRTRILYDSLIDSNKMLPVSKHKVVPENPVIIREGAVGLKGVSTLTEGISYVRDPEQLVEFVAAESLQFEYYCETPKHVSVVLHTVGGKIYKADKELLGDENWQREQLPMSLFKDRDLKKLTTWENVWRIDFMCIQGSLINKLLLV